MDNGYIYPIKYAILRVSKNNNNINDIAAYVVVKCYVISDIIDYSFNEEKHYYNVVYSFSINNNELVLAQPMYNEYGECINMVRTNNIYNNYDEAKKCAIGLNNNLIDLAGSITSNIDPNQNLLLLIEKKKKEIEFYNLLENEILSKTKFLKITKKKLR